MKRIFSIFIALCWLYPSLAFAVGQVRIERQGENTTSGINSAPYSPARVDSQAPATTNPITFTSLTAGSHTAKVTAIHGLPTVTAGTCTYAVGGGECTVATFNLTPTCDYAAGECTQTVTVTDDVVTKIAFKFASSYVGFGASTVGGRAGAIIEVTNLNNTGAGSFRQALLDACNTYNKYIVFRVSGNIVGGAEYSICGHDITIDGFTAPSPGITILGSNLKFVQWDAKLAESDNRDVILRGLRIDGNGIANTIITFDPGSSYTGPNRSNNVVIDHNTLTRSPDDIMGFAREVHDITFSWNLIHTPLKSRQNMISIGFAYNLSVHHNLLAPNSWRNPLIKHYSDTGQTTPSPNLTMDFRNNFILHGNRLTGESCCVGTLIATSVTTMARANIVKNYYLAAPESAANPQGMERAIQVCTPSSVGRPAGIPTGTWNCGGVLASTASGGVFVNGNILNSAYHSALTFDPNAQSYLTAVAYAATSINETAAEVAACTIVDRAGVFPRQAADTAWIDKAKIELAKFHDCGASTPAVEAQLSGGGPTGILAAGTTTATLEVTSNVAATCKYGTIAGTAYASIANTFTTTGGTAHSQNLTSLTAGSYTYYVRCSTTVGSVVNTADFVISFSIATPGPGPTPTAPSGFTLVRSTTANEIVASWNDNSANEDNFNLWGSIAGKWTQVALLPANVTTYTTTVLSPGVIYCQNVQAVNTAGGSDFSDQPADCLTAPPLKVLSAAAVDAATGGKLNHQWQFPASDAGGILVLRRASSACTDRPTDGLTYSVNDAIGSCTVAFVGTTETTFSDTGLTSATTYHYAYFTKSVTGSRYAAAFSASATPTGPGAPGAPTGLGIGGGTGTFNPFSGFGASARIVHTTACSVTITDDTGAGSLRECLQQGVGKEVTFAVGGTFTLTTPIQVFGPVRIKGETAPSAVVLSGHGLVITNQSSVQISNIRIRDVNTSGEYGVLIEGASKGIALSGVSITSTTGNTFAAGIGILGTVDGCPHGVTVQWSLLDNNHTSGRNVLLQDAAGCQPKAITFHHNLLMRAGEQMLVAMGDVSDTAPSLALQISDSVFHDWNSGAVKKGIHLRHGSKANVTKNYFNFGAAAQQAAAENAFVIIADTPAPLAYVNGNTSGDEATYPGITATINARGTEGGAFAAPKILTHSLACIAAANVKNLAGALPRDATDTAIVDAITLGC